MSISITPYSRCDRGIEQRPEFKGNQSQARIVLSPSIRILRFAYRGLVKTPRKLPNPHSGDIHAPPRQ